MFKSFAGGPIGVNVGFEEAVELAAHYGFEGISMDVGYLMEHGPETVVQILEERDLKPGGWGLPMRLMAPKDEFNEKLKDLRKIADLCSRAGDLRCSTWQTPASDEMTFDEMFSFVRDRLEAIGKVFSEYDVRLGLEFIGPATSRAGKKYEFVHTMDGMLELCEAAGTGNIGLLLDCWHLYTSGGQMDDVLKLTDDDVVTVHINDAPKGIPLKEHKDNVRALPGETGVIGVPRFLKFLKRIGYTGPVIVEPFSDRVRQMKADEAIRVTKEAMDSVWPD
jgi:sugar phosphate isomerase/epimerase